MTGKIKNRNDINTWLNIVLMKHNSWLINTEISLSTVSGMLKRGK